MKRLMAVLCVLFVSASVSAKVKAPEWINGTSKQYPAQTYMLGVGIGDTLDSARSAARAEIAKIFKSKITQAAKDTSRENTLQGTTTSSNETAMSTSVSTDEMLEGVEIAQTWQHPKSKGHYALAVLNKTKLRAQLMSQITALEENIAAQVSYAKKSASTIDQIRAWSNALTAMDQKDIIVRKKSVLDPVAMPDLPSGMSRTEVEKERAAALGKIVFVITANDSKARGLIAEKVANKGFKVIPAVPEKPAAGLMVVTINGSIAAEPVDRGNPTWMFYNWTAGAEIADAAAGAVLSTIARQGQSSQLTDDMARAKAITDAGQELALAVDQYLDQYIFGAK